jgi:hypothetical protein
MPMASELLDFVMSLVRDPDAAARYAENPQQAIADAHLTNVTTADVSNLIPVVSESLPLAAPSHGVDAVADTNVWASGAATAAFDAFADHVPVQTTFEPTSAVLDQPSVAFVDPNVHHVDEPGPDVHQFDVGGFGDPHAMPAVDLPDVAPVVDPTPVDHSVGGEHGFAPDHGFAPGFDTPL